MPFYEAEVYTNTGDKKRLHIQASNEEEVLRRYQAQSYVVIAVKEEKPSSGFNLSSLFAVRQTGKTKPLTLEEQHLFCTTICSFMKSGLSLTEILSLLQKQTRNKNLKALYSDLKGSVENGRSLAASMKASGVFRQSIIGMVESGEKSASLAEILQKAGELIQNEIKLQRKLRSALTYPIMMLVVGLGVVVFLMSFVVPRLTELVVESGAELPFITKLLIFISDAVKIGTLPAIALGFGFYVWCKKHNKKFTLPMFKDINDNLAYAMIFSQTGTLLKTGIPLIKALRLTAPLDPVKGRLDVVADNIKEGFRFSQGLEKAGSFPEEIITVVRVGENGNNLPDTLIRLGENCWDYAQSSMQKWASLAEPAIILVMGLLVGFVVVAVLLPIFDLSSLAVM